MNLYKSQILRDVDISINTMNTILKKSAFNPSKSTFDKYDIELIIDTCENKYSSSHCKRELLVRYLIEFLTDSKIAI